MSRYFVVVVVIIIIVIVVVVVVVVMSLFPSQSCQVLTFLLFPFPGSALSGAAGAWLGIGALSLNGAESRKIRCRR